jgi:hypothetical protein
MRADNTQEIQEIVSQLQELQLQESELLERLAQLSDGVSHNDIRTQGDTVNTLTLSIHPKRLRDKIHIKDPIFVIGNRVQIKNPRFLQPTEGVIIKITAKRITVEASNGTTIVRAPKNICHIA